MHEIDPIVAIKKLREERAEAAVHAGVRALDTATAERDHAERRLREFREFSAAQEKRVFGRLCANVVRMRDIEDARAQVLALREREAGHAEDFQSAESTRIARERQLMEQRLAHRRALRVRDKFCELAEMFAGQARAETERGEDAEIEEAAGIGSARSATREHA